MQHRSNVKMNDSMSESVDFDKHLIDIAENDSRDSQYLKDDISKEWFYDDPEILEMEGYDEADPDSDFDYEDTYNKKAKKRKASAKVSCLF